MSQDSQMTWVLYHGLIGIETYVSGIVVIDITGLVDGIPIFMTAIAITEPHLQQVLEL